MSKYFVYMVAFHLTSKLWTRYAPLNAIRKSLTRERFVILSGLIQRMWTPGLLAQGVLAGCLVLRLPM
ncbi:hypothetical protein M9458_011662, partial [Cirrhinus mrigala]